MPTGVRTAGDLGSLIVSRRDGMRDAEKGRSLRGGWKATTTGGRALLTKSSRSIVSVRFCLSLSLPRAHFFHPSSCHLFAPPPAAPALPSRFPSNAYPRTLSHVRCERTRAPTLSPLSTIFFLVLFPSFLPSFLLFFLYSSRKKS